MARLSAVEKKVLGSEPILSANSASLDILYAYNWYSNVREVSDAKKYVLDYLKSKGAPQQVLDVVSKIEAYHLTNIGWNCRILSNGGVLPDSVVDSVMARLQSLINDTRKILAAAKDVPAAPKADTQLIDIIGELEVIIDKFVDGNPTDISEWFKTQTIKQSNYKKIADYYRPLHQELHEACKDVDPDLRFAYRRWNKVRLKKYRDFIGSIISVFEAETAALPKTPRKPRKKKIKPAKELVKKVKYKDKDDELGLTSIDPSTIVGASQLWVYNSKTRFLAVYHSIGDTGLSIKGTTIIGFDEKTSESKKLRKPKEFLPNVLNAGKVQLRSIMGKIKAKPTKASGRINSDTILLKAVK